MTIVGFRSKNTYVRSLTRMRQRSAICDFSSAETDCKIHFIPYQKGPDFGSFFIAELGISRTRELPKVLDKGSKMSFDFRTGKRALKRRLEEMRRKSTR